MRSQYKDAFLKKHNIKLGFMSAFVKASAYALQDQPVVNAGKLVLYSTRVLDYQSRMFYNLICII